MDVAVFGLGYVGTVTAACLTGLGHRVIGVDTNMAKVEQFERGVSPVLEPGVEELLAEALAEERIVATGDTAQAVAESEVALICVGTPSLPSGDIDLGHILGVTRQIGNALAGLPMKDSYTIVIRSTVLPGTGDRVAAIIEETTGRRPGQGFEVAVNPEFLREGHGVADFLEPSLILVGADQPTADKVLGLYEGIEADRRIVDRRVAELTKYANNSWHAAKVTFANEIGVIAKALGVDGVAVMNLLCADHRLNISPAYLRPGFAWGGSCLPKDVRALAYSAKRADVDAPLISSLIPSNSIHTERLIDAAIQIGKSRIGFVGLTFKAGTDDLRESPMVHVVERLTGKGYDCRIYDPELMGAELVGQNREYIDREIPHLGALMASTAHEVGAISDVLVVSRRSPEIDQMLREVGNDKIVLDLIGLPPELRTAASYEGVAW